jgi:hypothetical protein
MFSYFTRAFSHFTEENQTSFTKKEKTITIREFASHVHPALDAKLWVVGTQKSTRINRKINYTLPNGMKINSEVTSKTTFDAADKWHRGRGVEPYDADAASMLLEVISVTMADKVVEEIESGYPLERYAYIARLSTLVANLATLRFMGATDYQKNK